MTRGVYYNELDPYAVEWLRALIAAGHLPAGDVDDRSIADVQPGDVAGYRQCHWFAGIGGWALAAQLAGWPDDAELWTGSCPCQPWSTAGLRRGHDDPRDLWPHLHRLARSRRPARLVGEQVAGALGRAWFDRVSADLEGDGYASRAVDVPACAVGAPIRRQRIYWVAADVAGADGGRREADREQQAATGEFGKGVGRLPERRAADAGAGTAGRRNPWGDAIWLRCIDGWERRAQPGLRLLADGSAGWMAVLRPGSTDQAWVSRAAAWRGIGQAIVPQLAAEVLDALMDGQALP